MVQLEESRNMGHQELQETQHQRRPDSCPAIRPPQLNRGGNEAPNDAGRKTVNWSFVVTEEGRQHTISTG